MNTLWRQKMTLMSLPSLRVIPTVNTNGLTITGGPSVTRGGIDAGNRVISGVKAGDVSATSQEAVNGSQLHATNTKLDGVKAKADTAVQDVKSGDENALTAVKDPSTNIVTVTPKLSGDLVDANGNITAPTTPADKRQVSDCRHRCTSTCKHPLRGGYQGD